MDITVTPEEITQAISYKVKSLVKKEVSRIINELYVRDNKELREVVQLAVTQTIYELFSQPEMKEYLLEAGKEAASRKALSMVRNDMVRQNDNDKI